MGIGDLGREEKGRERLFLAIEEGEKGEEIGGKMNEMNRRKGK